jgi:Tfp pilus assembly protein PilX
MLKTVPVLKNEEGSTLIIALMMVAVLTVMGVAATNTSQTEVRIADNERRYQREFYGADSGWKDGAMWLDNKAKPPGRVNTDPTDYTVRNFGNGPTNTLNDDFPDGTEDNAMSGIPYWFKIEYVSDTIVPGSGKGYRNFKYDAVSNANRTQEIHVTLTKIYKVGY